MKFIVDEMPFWDTDCPFFMGGICKMDNEHCEYMEDDAGNRQCEKCRWLKEMEEPL